jgi:hypothetical protein
MGSAHTVVVLVAALAFAEPAAALQPGVFVDPGSPAGKEYSFPLSVLRGQANGNAAPGGAAQPLFGVGINRGARTGTGSAAARGSANSSGTKGRRRAGSNSHAPAGSGAGAGPGRRRPDAVLASLVRPSPVVPQITLITVALVLVGAAFGAGIAVARRRS